MLKPVKFDQLLSVSEGKKLSVYFPYTLNYNEFREKLDSLYLLLESLNYSNLSHQLKRIESDLILIHQSTPQKSFALFLSDYSQNYYLINSCVKYSHWVFDDFNLLPLLEEMDKNTEYGVIWLKDEALYFLRGDFDQLETEEMYSLDIKKSGSLFDIKNRREKLKEISQLICSNLDSFNPILIKGDSQDRNQLNTILNHTHNPCLDINLEACGSNQEILQLISKEKHLVIKSYQSGLVDELAYNFKKNKIKSDHLEIQSALTHGQLNKLYVVKNDQLNSMRAESINHLCLLMLRTGGWIHFLENSADLSNEVYASLKDNMMNRIHFNEVS